MAWSAVGTATVVDNSSSFTLTPSAVGDLIFYEIVNRDNATVVASGVSSSNITWTQYGVPLLGSVNSFTSVVWAGKVTSASAATVTITWSGAAPTNIRSAWQEFSSSLGAWVMDGPQGNTDTASGTTWASLTPSINGELYVGYARYGTGAVAGSTSGYVFEVLAADSNGLAYNLNCTGGVATAPVWGSTDSMFGIAVLIKEVSASPVQQFRVAPRRPQVRVVSPVVRVTAANAAPGAGVSGSVPVLMMQRTEIISRVTGRVVRR